MLVRRATFRHRVFQLCVVLCVHESQTAALVRDGSRNLLLQTDSPFDLATDAFRWSTLANTDRDVVDGNVARHTLGITGRLECQCWLFECLGFIQPKYFRGRSGNSDLEVRRSQQLHTLTSRE